MEASFGPFHGIDTADLREASLNLFADAAPGRARILHWAGFVAAGDWR
jgi:hypothetical protein